MTGRNGQFPSGLRILLLALIVAAFSGCTTPISRETRQASFEQYRSQFKADVVHLLSSVYYVLSLESAPQQIQIDPITGRLNITLGDDRKFRKGLAVGISADGYMITADHTVSDYCFIIGQIEGRHQVLRARVIHRSGAAPEDGDFALLKIDAELVHYLEIAPMPAVGDVVFAVVFEPAAGAIGGRRDIAAGVVRGFEHHHDKQFSFIDSSVPFRRGDSGGALVTTRGQLIGITKGGEYVRKGHQPAVFRRWSVRPDPSFVRSFFQ